MWTLDYIDICGLHVPSLKFWKTDVKVSLMKSLWGTEWKVNIEKIDKVKVYLKNYRG